MVKNLPASEGDARDEGLTLGLEDALKEEKNTPVFLPGKFHGQRRLVGYIP